MKKHSKVGSKKGKPTYRTPARLKNCRSVDLLRIRKKISDHK